MGELNRIERMLADEVAGRFAQVLEAMTGAAVRTSWKPLEPTDSPPSGEGLVWWQQPLSVAPEPAFWVGAPDATWTEIGTRSLMAAGVDQPEAADIRSTYQEILTQTLAAVAQAIGGFLHREVVCAKGGESSDYAPGLTWLCVDLHFDEDSAHPLYVALGAQLIRILAPAAVLPPPGGAEPPAAKAAAATATEPGPPVPSGGAIDLLLDVELPVAVSFGRTQIPLKDVIKLTTGSIVELNRSVSEPVEVIVNNCVIARGEVVVIEGNYGVRIEHIISPQERLRTLH